jgi:hypothetical protein
MGGGDDKANLVGLTPEEHYVAHQLLVKMHKSNIGLVWASVNMSYRAGRNKAYGWLRRRLANEVSEMNRGNKYSVGRKHTPEQRARNSAARIGKPLPREQVAKMVLANTGRKMSADHRAKMEPIWAAQRGQKRNIHFTAEARAKISATHKGNTRARGKKLPPRSAEFRLKMRNANLGKRHSAETRAKISAIQVGKKLTAEHRAKISAGMRGNRNCIGIKQSLETRAKRSDTLHLPDVYAKLVAANTGRVPWNKGKTFKKEQ